MSEAALWRKLHAFTIISTLEVSYWLIDVLFYDTPLCAYETQNPYATAFLAICGGFHIGYRTNSALNIPRDWKMALHHILAMFLAYALVFYTPVKLCFAISIVHDVPDIFVNILRLARRREEHVWAAYTAHMMAWMVFRLWLFTRLIVAFWGECSCVVGYVCMMLLGLHWIWFIDFIKLGLRRSAASRE